VEGHTSYPAVRVVDDDDDPVESVRVMIVIHHSFEPATNLEKFTNEDGIASFDFRDSTSADVYVRGSRRLDHVGLGW
jgi:hypothetical protein